MDLYRAASGEPKEGLASKPHAVCDGLGRPVRLLLTAGNVSDIVDAGELLKDLQDSGEPKKGDLHRAASAKSKEDLAANCTSFEMRDAPREYGPYKTLYNRFIRWSRLGVFAKIFQKLSKYKAKILMMGCNPSKGSQDSGEPKKGELPRSTSGEPKEGLVAS